MLNIVIPMAGRGSRFAVCGYEKPKPFIDVKGKPMIQRVIDNMSPKEEYRLTLIARTEHGKYIDGLSKKANVVYVDEVTEGAACTVLLGVENLPQDEELIIINSDQLIEWGVDGIQGKIDFARKHSLNGCISTFFETSNKFSFAKCTDNGTVTEVAEKKVISNDATAGTYYFSTIKSFVDAANEMIARNVRVNNEFYVCPVYNVFLEAFPNVRKYQVSFVHELGTPEGLIRFLSNEKIQSDFI